jgi:hypothetical protein
MAKRAKVVQNDAVDADADDEVSERPAVAKTGRSLAKIAMMSMMTIRSVDTLRSHRGKKRLAHW